MGALPTQLDGLQTEHFGQWTVVYNIGDRLVDFGDKGQFLPNLAQSWQASDDGRTYTFSLVEGRKFHNGDVVTVDDVLHSLQRSIEQQNSYGKLCEYIECSEQSNGLSSGLIKLSEREFQIKLKKPDFSFLRILNMNENMVRSKSEDLKGRTVYSGIYQASSQSSLELKLVANTAHPRFLPQMFQSISIKKIPEDENAWKEILKNETSIFISKGLSMRSTSENAPFESHYFKFASGNSFILSIREDVPDSQYIKYAVQQALNSPGLFSENKDLEPLRAFYHKRHPVSVPYKYQRIDRPLKQISIKIMILQGLLSQNIRMKLVESLAQQGIHLTLIEVGAEEVNKSFESVRVDGIIASLYLDSNDEVNFARGYFSGYWNYFSKPSPELLNLLEIASNETVEEKRTVRMKEFYKNLLGNYNFIPLFHTPNMIFMSKDISRELLEYQGNTLKFDLFRRI
jgi:ABC-type transport system substrate-binding protein